MTEEGPENIVDALVKRTSRSTVKLKLEMAVKAIQTGAFHMLQISETSKKEMEQQISSQFYFILVQKIQSEAFDLVKNVPEQNGIEARRRFCNSLNALALGKRVHLIRKHVNPLKIKKLQEAMGMIERWEDSTRRLQAEYDEHLSDWAQDADSAGDGSAEHHGVFHGKAP